MHRANSSETYALALVACVPSRATYVKPFAPGGKHINSLCGGAVGPKDRLIIADSTGVMVGVETFRLKDVASILEAPPRTGTGLTVIFHVPEGRSLRFASRSFVITDRGTTTVHEREPTRVFSGSGVLLDGFVAGMEAVRPDTAYWPPVDISEPLVGRAPVRGFKAWGKQQWFGTKVTRAYYAIVELENVLCPDCTLRMPRMMVDSTALEFPEIRLRRVREWYVSPLNC